MRKTCVALAMFLASFAGASASGAAGPGPALKQVIEKARQEGRLDLSWVPSIFGNDGVKEMAARMNAMYGTDIRVTFTPDPGSIPQTLNKLMVSQSANQPAPSDLFVGTTTHFPTLLKARALQVPGWKQLLPDRIDDAMVEGDGSVVRVFTTLPGGIVYNTDLAPAKPENLVDLLRPEWKGKVATTAYAASFDNLSASDFWGEQRTLDFARKFSGQVGGFIGCGSYERIATGEFAAFAMDCLGRNWVSLKRQGAPVGFSVPKDFAVLRYYYLAVPRNAAHPNAALLFAAFLLTKEGQSLIWKHDDTDLHTFPDSQMGQIIHDYEKDGRHFREVTISWLAQQPDARPIQQKVMNIIRNR